MRELELCLVSRIGECVPLSLFTTVSIDLRMLGYERQRSYSNCLRVPTHRQMAIALIGVASIIREPVSFSSRDRDVIP